MTLSFPPAIAARRERLHNLASYYQLTKTALYGVTMGCVTQIYRGVDYAWWGLSIPFFVLCALAGEGIYIADHSPRSIEHVLKKYEGRIRVDGQLADSEETSEKIAKITRARGQELGHSPHDLELCLEAIHPESKKIAFCTQGTVKLIQDEEIWIFKE